MRADRILESMTVAQLDDLILNAPLEGRFKLGTKSIDWGRRRGQGRRSGNMSLGAMSDITLQDVKHYTDVLMNIPDLPPDDRTILIDGLPPIAPELYLRARNAGLDNDTAITYIVGKLDHDPDLLALASEMA